MSHDDGVTLAAGPHPRGGCRYRPPEAARSLLEAAAVVVVVSSALLLLVSVCVSFGGVSRVCPVCQCE